jgi:hypothetical protein
VISEPQKGLRDNAISEARLAKFDPGIIKRVDRTIINI